ncbi:MAG TPA: FdhF/YdeP family oxidoreductase [Acidimicrobiales bacterium]|nr:FdhF/YdeP family oxidoreductase [Acidimicrobiales bacterium]
MRRREKRFDPQHWASLRPFGWGEQKPNNYRSIIDAVSENSDNLAYAWRILNHGVCDGCALGTTGMRDWTLSQVHLCNVRLRLLRLNTAPAMDASLLADVSRLAGKRSSELHKLGRLPYPMVRRHGEPGFVRADWDQALELVAATLRAVPPERVAVYMTSRGQPNENYYAVQKAVRALGTNSIDSAARLCHSPSTLSLKDALGVAATTCSYTDLIGTDLIVFIGSNVAENQPVMMKYLYHARKAGTRVAVVNPYREPAMERYWVPSNIESALFGTKMTDRFFELRVGGDIAFFNGALKHMIARGWVDRAFIDAHTSGFADTAALLASEEWEDLEQAAGAGRAEMMALARMLGEASTAVLVWSMGVTQHRSGEDAVRAIVNVALARGFVGRDKCGVMPIRGHSGVQGGAEMGAYATALPGGKPINTENARHFSELWGFDVPALPGLTAPEMVDAAAEGRLDALLCSGGNFLGVLPGPDRARQALERVRLRAYVDIVPSAQMLVPPAPDGTVVLLPAQTRYEMEGGVTETSTERRVIFSPEIPGPRIEEARPEWEIFMELAQRARPERAKLVHFAGTEAIREEISSTVPNYALIRTLRAEGDQFQYGGDHLCTGWQFPTPDGKAHFAAVALPAVALPAVAPPAGAFWVTTRRGRQFNSMVQGDRDGHTGAGRDAVLINTRDAAALGVRDGDSVLLTSDHGHMTAKAKLAPVALGTLQVHWPEGLVLLDATERSSRSGIPEGSALVRVARAGA